MILTRFLATLLLLANLSACTGIRPAPPEVQLSSLEVTDVSLSHANFMATLSLFNPNDINLNVEAVMFSLYLNGVRIAKGRTTKALLLPSEGSGDIAIRLSSSFLALFQLSSKLQNQEEVTFRIDGEIRLGGFGILATKIPIEHEGSLPLSGDLRKLRADNPPALPSPPLEGQILRQ